MHIQKTFSVLSQQATHRVGIRGAWVGTLHKVDRHCCFYRIAMKPVCHFYRSDDSESIILFNIAILN
jgi:hypothetical protein